MTKDIRHGDAAFRDTASGDAIPDDTAPANVAPADAALVQAYRETDYRIETDPPLVLRVGAHHAGLAALHAARGVAHSAFVTAFNPFSVRLADDENAARHRALCEALSRDDIAWLPAVGAHPSNGWPAERGVLLLGVERARAEAIGRRWAQHAIVCCGDDAVPELVMLATRTDGA